MTEVKAWIEPIKTINGERFRVVEQSILFPGKRNIVRATWKQRRSASNYIKNNGRTFVRGACPLPAVTQQERDEYINRPR